MKRWLLLALFFLANTGFSQDLLTKVIQLQYIPASQALQLMQPLLQADDKISGSGQTLIVKVNPQTLTQIRTVLHQIDVAPVTFTVSVYQGDPQWLSQQNDNTVSYSTSTRSQKLQSQAIEVMSGHSALVSMDQQVPIVSDVGLGFFTGVAYQQQQVKNGILLQPVLRGSQVELKVRRLREQANPAGGAQFDKQQMNTTLMMPLNKWVALGSPAGAETINDNLNSFSAGNTYDQQSTLYIKVSVVGAKTKTGANSNLNQSW